MSDRLGTIEKVEEVDGGIKITVRFDSPEAMQTAQNILRNIGRHFLDLEEDRLMVGLATKDFYDGP